MELKKFEAPTLAQALQVVKRELGPEAIIISTKNNKTGFGLLNSTSVEVTAAISREALERKFQAELRMTDAQKSALNQKSAAHVTKAYDVLSGARMERQMARAENLTPSTRSRTSSFASQSEPARQTVQSRQSTPLTQRRYVDIRDDESPAEQLTARVGDRRQLAPSPEPLRATGPVLPKLVAELLEAGVDADLARELGDELRSVMLKEQLTKEDLLRLQLARIIMGRVRVARPLGERLRLPGTPRMISFVGPTGVGKTTTIAKIAAELVIHQKKPVVLATTDTYKIAAIDQLQTYANILNVPLEVCPTGESLEALAASLDPETVILVDTAGYGPKDESKIQELAQLLATVRTEIHLCLAAMTRDKELIRSIQRFRIFDPQYLVMTKLDETSSFGTILNLASKSQLPLSYFTMGQRVPEDMEVATKERLADLILKISGEA
jgi:flagellar biosynthesis protein FlhF